MPEITIRGRERGEEQRGEGRRAEGQRGRGAEEQRSRGAEEQRSRGEKQREGAEREEGDGKIEMVRKLEKRGGRREKRWKMKEHIRNEGPGIRG